MAGITRETAALHGQVASSVQQQLDGFAQRFEERSGTWVDAMGAQLGQQSGAVLLALDQAQSRQHIQQVTRDEQQQAACGPRRLRTSPPHCSANGNRLARRRWRSRRRSAPRWKRPPGASPRKPKRRRAARWPKWLRRGSRQGQGLIGGEGGPALQLYGQRRRQQEQQQRQREQGSPRAAHAGFRRPDGPDRADASGRRGVRSRPACRHPSPARTGPRRRRTSARPAGPPCHRQRPASCLRNSGRRTG